LEAFQSLLLVGLAKDAPLYLQLEEVAGLQLYLVVEVVGLQLYPVVEAVGLQLYLVVVVVALAKQH
jgi:hypothetical protein